MSTGTDNATWVLPRGSAAAAGWEVVVGEREGWRHTRLHAGDLAPDERRALSTDDCEFIVVPLSGAVTVQVTDASGGEHRADLAGRTSVFAGATDVAYVPRGATLQVTAGAGGARVALCGALADKAPAALPFRHLRAEEIPLELRGAGVATREVRNFGLPDVLDADSILACEVVTPAGNWSSWPPHKHDEFRPGVETALEEIYYYEMAGVDDRIGDPVGYQRVYGTEQRPLDVLAEVRTGDVVLVPHGWHGPAIASPDAHMYYLNVMAGPGPGRAWQICDDPAHAAVRETWADLTLDPRLPMGM